MSKDMFNNISNTTSTSSQGEAEIACDGGEKQTEPSYPGASKKEILDLISNRRRTSSEYLSKKQAEEILYDEVAVEDVNDVFNDVISTLQKLLVDISVLERSRLTQDVDANWDDLHEISSSAINICDRSFDEPTLQEGRLEYRLGTQVGRILTGLTGQAPQDRRAALFYAGLSNQYTKNNRDYKPYTDRSELINKDSKGIHFALQSSGMYADHLSDETKELVKNYGYDMDMNLIYFASMHNFDPPSRIYYKRDAKEIHDDVVDLLENRLGRWFGMCIDIRHRLTEEWNDIDKASTSGLSARDALSELWDMTVDGPKMSVESKQIAKKYRKTSYHKQVSQVFNSLSYQSKSKHSQADKQLKNDIAIVTYNQGWRFTPYGYLLCLYQLHGNDDIIGKIALDEIKAIREVRSLSHPDGFDKEMIRQALEQFYDADVPKHF
jgi:hypothetical protein